MGKKSGPKSVSTLTGDQKQIAANLAQFLIPKIGQGATPYTGQLTANLIPQYQTALNTLSSYQPGAQVPGVNTALAQALSGKPSFSPNLTQSDTNSYFKSAVLSPMLHAFDTQIAPRINESFGGVGAFTSRRGTALSQALSDIMTNAGQQQAQLAQSNMQLNAQLGANLADSAANRQLSAIGQANQQSLLPITQAAALTQALAPFQQSADQGVQAQYQEFLRTSPENSPYTQQALAALGVQQKAMYNPENPVTTTIGGLSGLASLGLLLSMF